MSRHGAISGGNHRFAGGWLLGALASGALAVASLGSAGVANATCVSFSGFHNGGGCETTNLGDTAIGLGPRTTVSASGGFNTSIAIGADATAESEGVGNAAIAVGNVATAVAQGSGVTKGVGNIAVAVGNTGPNPGYVDPILGDIPPNDPQPATAGAFGRFNRVAVFGNGSTAFAFGPIPNIPGGNNTAITVGSGSNSNAFGANRFAAALGSNRHAINGINNAPTP
jgi:hypothetical protein